MIVGHLRLHALMHAAVAPAAGAAMADAGAPERDGDHLRHYRALLMSDPYLSEALNPSGPLRNPPTQN